MSQRKPPKLFGVMPGALMYRVEPSNGIAHAELDVMRQVRCVSMSPVFANVPAVQRDSLIESIVHTIGRADYHYERLCAQGRSLGEMRAWAPGEIFYDGAVSVMHYELQALAGAARLLVDELVFLISVRHGQRGWEAVPIFRDPVVPGSPVDLPEVHRLRAHRHWFDLLNAYRNTFFHRGWRHGSGHYDSDGRQAAEVPRMNGLLVPDRASLSSRSRPYDWTYNDKATVGGIGSGIHDGMIAMVGELCVNEWCTAVPAPGQIPDEKRPNLFVMLPAPIPLTVGDSLLVPVFSSRERAMSLLSRVPRWSLMVDSGDLELVEIRSNRDVSPDSETISLSFARLSEEPGVTLLRVVLDPEPQNDQWSEIRATAVAEMPLGDLIADKIRIVSIPVPNSMVAYVWRAPFLAP